MGLDPYPPRAPLVSVLHKRPARFEVGFALRSAPPEGVKIVAKKDWAKAVDPTHFRAGPTSGLTPFRGRLGGPDARKRLGVLPLRGIRPGGKILACPFHRYLFALVNYG